MKNIWLIIATTFICTAAKAQNTVVSDRNIHSVQCVANNDWSQLPIIGLNDDMQINISFDELSHDYRKFHYTIRHCDHNWQPTDMLDSEYISGFNDQTIDDYAQSMNTTVPFNHYSITLPNEQIQFKLSGNYKLIVFEDGKSEEEPSFTTNFHVVDRKILVEATISGNTDINNRTTSQQLDISMNLTSMRINDSKTELTTIVTQNRRYETRRSVEPSYISSSSLKFEHNRDLIFDGNNEYRRFEVTNHLNGTMGVDRIRWNKAEEHFDVFLFEDEPRQNYSYDEDKNGLFYIRNENREDIDTESDYMLVHFSLKSEPLVNERVFINGAFTGGCFIPEYEMQYNTLTQRYEQAVLLKQGQYNYLYTNQKSKPLADIEGNFYETRNEYQIFVYYHPFGARYDQLIGFCQQKN